MPRLEALHVTVLAATLLTGCNEAPPTSIPGNVGGTAVVESGDLAHPMPILFATHADAEAVDLLFPSLIRPQWNDGSLIRVTADRSPMALARRWERVGGDQRGVRFHLRTDARWSDGRPITARDVAFTFETLRDPRSASPRQNMTHVIDAVTVENDSTVTFSFTTPQLDPLELPSHPIAPAHVYAESDLSELRHHPTFTDLTRLVVYGPFRIVRHDRGQQVVLERNPSFQPRAMLDRLIFRMMPDQNARILELKNGNLDRITVGAFGRRAIGEIPGLQVTLTVPKSLFYIHYNRDHFAPFADQEIRRAMGLALDVPVLQDVLNVRGNTLRAAGPYSPYLSVFDSTRMRPLPFDTTRANRILDGRGWRDTDGDGIRDKDGRPLRFEILVPSADAVDVTIAAQAMWRRIGVDAQLLRMEQAGAADRARRGEFDAFMSGKGASMHVDLANEWLQGSRVGFGYGSPDLDRRILAAQQLADPAAQERAWQDIAVHLADEQPITWLWWVSLYEVLSPRLRGVNPTTWSEFDNAWEWYQPAEYRRAYGRSAGA